jgi:hypothetical protein
VDEVVALVRRTFARRGIQVQIEVELAHALAVEGHDPVQVGVRRGPARGGGIERVDERRGLDVVRVGPDDLGVAEHAVAPDAERL